MVYLYDAVLAVLLFVYAEQMVEYRAFGIRIPAAVASGCFNLHACHVKTRGYHVHYIVFHVLACRTRQELDERVAAFDVDDGKVA